MHVGKLYRQVVDGRDNDSKYLLIPETRHLEKVRKYILTVIVCVEHVNRHE